MEDDSIKNWINSKVDGAVLEKRFFGRTNVVSFWLEASALTKVAQLVLGDEKTRMDWLENLSAIQMDQAIVLSYFLRSTITGQRMVFRVSLVPENFEATVQIKSVSTIWPMATLLERDIADLFGVNFEGNKFSVLEIPSKRSILSDDFEGFPLRKSFVFPNKTGEVTH